MLAYVMPCCVPLWSLRLASCTVLLSTPISSSVYIVSSSIMAHAGIKSSYSYLWAYLQACTQARLPAVILLSFVLAVGFLLVILSCALWANWLPLLVGALHMRVA